MSDEKRPYRKKRRAELEEETRRRITESAVALHGSLGPSRTSMSAVAEHARVRRSTLYRHFPDEEALFDACSAHWRAANPAPDIDEWAGIDDPDERLRVALEAMYAYYRRTEAMIANLLRDFELPAVGSRMAAFLEYLDAIRGALLRGRPRRRAVGAAIGHALAFTTWRSLARDQQLSDRQAVELMCRLVAAAAWQPGSSIRSAMPTEAQFEFFARWNEAARRQARAEDQSATMSRRLEEAARLSAVASELRDGVDDTEPDVRRS